MLICDHRLYGNAYIWHLALLLHSFRIVIALSPNCHHTSGLRADNERALDVSLYAHNPKTFRLEMMHDDFLCKHYSLQESPHIYWNDIIIWWSLCGTCKTPPHSCTFKDYIKYCECELGKKVKNAEKGLSSWRIWRLKKARNECFWNKCMCAVIWRLLSGSVLVL